MGYDLHITRQETWFDENVTRQISFDEWKNILSTDNEMRLDGFAEAATQNGETIRVESKGLSVWIKYSGDGLKGNHAWFDYREGNIVVKNPDDEIVNKMLDIAERLDAKVQGDDGEIYKRTTDNKIFSKNIDEGDDSQTDTIAPWGKF